MSLRILLVSFLILTGGCDSGKAPEVAVGGPLPNSAAFDKEAVSIFAAELASTENLTVVYPRSVDLERNPGSLFQLKPNDGTKVTVTIRAYFSERRLWISAMDNFNPERAEKIITKAVTIAEEKFPGIRLARVTEKKGIFGP